MLFFSMFRNGQIKKPCRKLRQGSFKSVISLMRYIHTSAAPLRLAEL